jgi:hypothetical protein
LILDLRGMILYRSQFKFLPYCLLHTSYLILCLFLGLRNLNSGSKSTRTHLVPYLSLGVFSTFTYISFHCVLLLFISVYVYFYGSRIFLTSLKRYNAFPLVWEASCWNIGSFMGLNYGLMSGSEFGFLFSSSPFCDRISSYLMGQNSIFMDIYSLISDFAGFSFLC